MDRPEATVSRLIFMNDHLDWVADKDITIRLAKDPSESIAGSNGYLTTYLVEYEGDILAVVPGWAVEAHFCDGVASCNYCGEEQEEVRLSLLPPSP